MANQRLGLRLPFFESLKMYSTVVVTFFIIMIGLVFVIFYYETFLTIIPGYYQFSDYEKLISKRNDLVDENNFLVSENVQLTEKINSLSASSKDFTKKREIADEIRTNTEKALKNLKTLDKVNTDILNLRLISKLHNYMKMLDEVDEISEDTRNKELDIAKARRYFYDFRILESQFNECIATVDRSDASYSKDKEAKIATTINGCLTTLDAAQEKVNVLEDYSKIELPLTTLYLQNSENFWKSSYNFHKYLSEGNVTEAEKHNNQAAEYQRIITELDLDQVFEEFNDKVLAKLINDVTTLIEEAETKQKEADTYFETSLK